MKGRQLKMSERVICNESGKVCMNYKAAKTVANSVRHSRIHRKGHRPFRCYKCEFCGCWHLTSREGNKPLKKVKKPLKVLCQ